MPIVNAAAPSSQKADVRPISFVLDDMTRGQTAPVTLDLAIRPEELSRNDPSRLSVQQTLGGAWGDNFGPGVPTINISGHTGWRRGYGPTTADGVQRFADLFQQVFTGWHDARAAAAAAGNDPSLVKLIFADALDGFAVEVAPMAFTLRRSRSRPLLMQFQIAMTVLSQQVDALGYLQFSGGSTPLGVAAQNQLGLASMSVSTSTISSYASQVSSMISGTLQSPVQSLLSMSASLYTGIQSAVGSASQVTDQLVALGQTVAVAGANVFHTLAAVTQLGTFAKGSLMQVAAAYRNIGCVLSNSIQQQVLFNDFQGLYGSSNCSSTAGGSPISTYALSNPFDAMFPGASSAPFGISTSASSSLSALAQSDPVAAPLSTSALQFHLGNLASGLSIL